MQTKDAWRAEYFGDELPDCLPLPDRKEKKEPAWQAYCLSLSNPVAEEEVSAGLFFLLGMYAGAGEAAFLAVCGNACFPVRASWNDDTPPAGLTDKARKMLEESASFSWTEDEAAEALGWEPGRGIALCLDDTEIPERLLSRLALVFSASAKELTISYDSARYSEEFIKTLALSWREILTSLPVSGRMAELRITAAETMQALDGFNETRREYDRRATIVDQFRAQAEKSPDNLAVAYEERSFSYAEVDDLSDRIARYLAGQGIGRGDTVAVFIPRSEYMVIASLGVLKAGCAYEPLDPNYPDERLSFMAKDAAAKLVIVGDGLIPRLANFDEFPKGTLPLSKIGALSPAEKTALKDVEPPKPDDLFTLIYTSGTTGVPKGVRLLHRNIMAYAAWYRHFFSPTEKSRVTCYNSYGFDGSLTDMYPALTVGAAVVVIPEEKKLDLPAVADIIRQHGVSIADLPSQVGRQFALTMDCPTLKYIVGGGEKLVPFEPVYPYIFANEYGPTEATVAITCYNMTKYEPDVPIGKPMDNTAIYIVDGAGRRVPRGALGELWVAGEQVTDGYLNRPEKTNEVFVPNPFTKEKGYETAYRTGDVVRYLTDGNIEFAGRRDGLVKIRGFRVELAEVEGVVRDFPAVKDAAVAAFDNPAGGKFIAAYVTSDTPIDRDALATFIRERKPPYMVPAAIVELDIIPRNQNGKLNKRALPVPELHASESAYVAPKNATEAALVKGFATALGMERVSAEEDFFEAGGDSLSVVRLLSECRELRLNFNLIYEGKTPAGIARLLAARDEKESKSGKKRETHFLGPLHQLHYEWGNELEEGYGVHCDATVHLAPETDMERLATAVETALLAHPAVDARLSLAADGTLRWRPGDCQDMKPRVEKLSRADYEALKPKLRRPMNRPETRMFTTRLFEITEPDGTTSRDLYFDFLHPIIDGDSIEIFLADIDAAYRGEKPEPEEYSVLDYYDEIEDRITGEPYQKEQQWNREFVRSFTDRLSELPGDLDPQGENETKAIFLPIRLDLAAADRFAKEHGVTDGTLLAAAFGLLQGHANGERAGVVLTFYNGRDDIRFERTMGALYRHYPSCVRWTEAMTAGQFVKETQENILLCRRHALYEGDPVPIIISFAYQGEDTDEGFAFCGGRAQYDEVEDYEDEIFNFYVHRRQDGYYVALTYNTRAYSEAFVARFVENYAKAIRGLISGEKPSAIEAAL